MPQPRAVTLVFANTGARHPIDCTDSFDPQYSADITRYPTESGNPVTDHRDIQPKALNLSGLMSDVHPYRSGDPEALDPAAPVAYDLNGTGFHTSLRDALLAAHENSELITVEAGRRGTWADMLIASLSLPEPPENGAAVAFSVSLIHLSIAETKTQNLVAASNAAVLQQQLVARTGDAEDMASLAKSAIGGKVVKSPLEVQRHSPMINHGLTIPQPTSMRQTLGLTPFAGAPALGAWAR
jgi:hypothetical protein